MEQIYQKYLSTMLDYQYFDINAEWGSIAIGIFFFGTIVMSIIFMSAFSRWVPWQIAPVLGAFTTFFIGFPFFENSAERKVEQFELKNSIYVLQFEKSLDESEIEKLNYLIYRHKQLDVNTEKDKNYLLYLKSTYSDKKELIWKGDDIYKYFNSEEFKRDLKIHN